MGLTEMGDALYCFLVVNIFHAKCFLKLGLPDVHEDFINILQNEGGTFAMCIVEGGGK